MICSRSVVRLMFVGKNGKVNMEPAAMRRAAAEWQEIKSFREQDPRANYFWGGGAASDAHQPISANAWQTQQAVAFHEQQQYDRERARAAHSAQRVANVQKPTGIISRVKMGVKSSAGAAATGAFNASMGVAGLARGAAGAKPTASASSLEPGAADETSMRAASRDGGSANGIKSGVNQYMSDKKTALLGLAAMGVGALSALGGDPISFRKVRAGKEAAADSRFHKKATTRAADAKTQVPSKSQFHQRLVADVREKRGASSQTASASTATADGSRAVDAALKVKEKIGSKNFDRAMRFMSTL